jgi:hypothetical protein
MGYLFLDLRVTPGDGHRWRRVKCFDEEDTSGSSADQDDMRWEDGTTLPLGPAGVNPRGRRSLEGERWSRIAKLLWDMIPWAHRFASMTSPGASTRKGEPFEECKVRAWKESRARRRGSIRCASRYNRAGKI